MWNVTGNSESSETCCETCTVVCAQGTCFLWIHIKNSAFSSLVFLKKKLAYEEALGF